MNIIFAEIGPWHTYIYKITQEIGIPSQIMFCLGAIYFPKERRGVGANQGVISTKIFLHADPLSLKPPPLSRCEMGKIQTRGSFAMVSPPRAGAGIA